MTLIMLAAAAMLQTAAPAAAPATADRTAPSAGQDAQAVDDKIAALVAGHRCDDAHDAAVASGRQDLVTQVQELCGVGASPSGSRSGHGPGGGRRGAPRS